MPFSSTPAMNQRVGPNGGNGNRPMQTADTDMPAHARRPALATMQPNVQAPSRPNTNNQAPPVASPAGSTQQRLGAVSTPGLRRPLPPSQLHQQPLGTVHGRIQLDALTHRVNEPSRPKSPRSTWSAFEIIPSMNTKIQETRQPLSPYFPRRQSSPAAVAKKNQTMIRTSTWRPFSALAHEGHNSLMLGTEKALEPISVVDFGLSKDCRQFYTANHVEVSSELDLPCLEPNLPSPVIENEEVDLAEVITPDDEQFEAACDVAHIQDQSVLVEALMPVKGSLVFRETTTDGNSIEKLIPDGKGSAVVLPGFEGADSTNIPYVDFIQLALFIARDVRSWSPELQNTKAEHNMRQSYVENAVGYMQVRKTNNVSVVFARVSPETTAKGVPYIAELQSNGKSIILLRCYGCLAQYSLCKHSLALLASVHYRSTAPSCTEKACYWKRSVLSTVGDLRLPVVKFTKNEEPPKLTSHYNSNGSFAKQVFEHIKSAPDEFGKSMLFRQISDQGHHSLSMHTLAYKFVKLGITETPGNFLAFAQTQYNKKLIEDVGAKTTTQSLCSLWKDMRYGRITASFFNEVHSCSTKSQEVIIQKKVFGASEVHQTFAMTRGLEMEDPVRQQFAKDKNTKVGIGYLQMSAQHPHLAASPDGIGDNFIVEVKTPSKNENIKNFIRQDGRPVKKVLLQMLLQMHLCRKRYGYLLVPDESFLQSSKYEVVKVCLDIDSADPKERAESEANADILLEALKKAEEFWSSKIFSLILRPMRPLIVPRF